MGVWLTDHFDSQGHTVVSFDERRGDDARVLGDADIVVVSVPVSETPRVLREALGHMRNGTMIVEIASLKNGIHREMVNASMKGFKALSVHPLFGPSVRDLHSKTVAVIPVKDAAEESKWAAELFPGAIIEEVAPEKHDRLMVHVLSLPYLVNLAFASTMSETDLGLLKRMSGTSFTLQYTLIQSVVGETTGLVHALLSENCFLEETAEALISSMREIMAASKEKEVFSALHESISEPMKADCRHGRAQELRQAAYNAVRPLLR